MKNNINNENNGEILMAWDEPPKNEGDKDPWGNPRKKPNNNDGPPDFDEFLKGLGKLFGGGGSNGSGGGKNDNPDFGKSLALVLSLAIVVFTGFVFAKGFYKVDEREQAVVLRLGKFHSIANAGLNYAIPFFDTVDVVDFQTIESIKIAKSILTKEGNVISVEVEVQYQRSGVKEWVLNVQSPEQLLQLLTESAQRHVVGDTVMDDLMTGRRAEFAFQVKSRLQEDLQKYQTGVNIYQVNVLDVGPPPKVKDSYADVLRAREERVKLKNDAQRYRSRIIPEAQGAATQQLQEALAYKNRIVEEAKGDAARFESLYEQYALAPAVTRERLYLETVEQIYSESNKVIISAKEGNNMMVLPIDQLIKNNQK